MLIEIVETNTINEKAEISTSAFLIGANLFVIQ